MSNPVEIDTALAEKIFRRDRIQQRIAGYQYRIDHQEFPGAALRNIEVATEELADVQMQIDELNAQYTGWQRYYHVTNANGHVHTSMHCSSCFPDTQFAWRTDLSGFTMEEVVDREAYNACTVCLPIAPAEQKAARLSQTNAAKAARQAERDAKAAEKDRKGTERAVKLVDKVEAVIEKLGGRETFLAEYEMYEHNGKKPTYGMSWMDEYKHLKINTTTEDILSYIVTDDRWNKPNDYVLAELTKRGLI